MPYHAARQHEIVDMLADRLFQNDRNLCELKELVEKTLARIGSDDGRTVLSDVPLTGRRSTRLPPTVTRRA